jgi:hypothetical protein
MLERLLFFVKKVGFRDDTLTKLMIASPELQVRQACAAATCLSSLRVLPHGLFALEHLLVMVLMVVVNVGFFFVCMCLVLGIENKVSCMLGTCTTIELHPQP